MIKENTTLILGAGSSAHIGYPLGSGLLNDLCSIRKFNKYPPLPEKWSIENVDEFLLSLSRSGHYSIDAFLETSDDRELGKFLITNQLKQYEDVDRLFPPSDSGWYQTLFNSLIDECGPDVGANNLSIITFNYDRSLEAYLHNAIHHRFKLSFEEAWEKVAKIPFIHVHGVLGEYPSVEYQKSSDVDTLLSISEDIHVIHEIQDIDKGYCNSEFEKANNLLEESDRIIFLGFGFHDDNVRRFNFFTAEKTKERNIYSTFTGLTAFEHNHLIQRLDVYGLKHPLHFHHGHDCSGLFRNYINL